MSQKNATKSSKPRNSNKESKYIRRKKKNMKYILGLYTQNLPKNIPKMFSGFFQYFLSLYHIYLFGIFRQDVELKIV